MGSTTGMELLDLPHAEACRLLATGAPVYLPINPVEYHGPHLSLHNDRLVTQGLVRDLHERLRAGHDWPLLLAADLELGFEPVHGRGSRHAGFPQLRTAVVEAVRALVELGAQRVVLATFHGAPLHNVALEAGVREAERLGARAVAPFNLVLRELLTLDPERFAPAVAGLAEEDRHDVLDGLAHDFHAGFFETSLALHYAPESVSPVHRELPPCPRGTPDWKFAFAAGLARRLGAAELASELSFAAVGMGWHQLRPFLGYTGRPDLASAEAGAVFARFVVDAYEPVVRAVFEGRASSPPPIMQWAARLSLGGWVGAIPAPPAG